MPTLNPTEQAVLARIRKRRGAFTSLNNADLLTGDSMAQTDAVLSGSMPGYAATSPTAQRVAAEAAQRGEKLYRPQRPSLAPNPANVARAQETLQYATRVGETEDAYYARVGGTTLGQRALMDGRAKYTPIEPKSPTPAQPKQTQLAEDADPVAGSTNTVNPPGTSAPLTHYGARGIHQGAEIQAKQPPNPAFAVLQQFSQQLPNDPISQSFQKERANLTAIALQEANGDLDPKHAADARAQVERRLTAQAQQANEMMANQPAEKPRQEILKTPDGDSYVYDQHGVPKIIGKAKPDTTQKDFAALYKAAADSLKASLSEAPSHQAIIARMDEMRQAMGAQATPADPITNPQMGGRTLETGAPAPQDQVEFANNIGMDIPRPKTVDEAMALPKGTIFIDPDGVERVR